MAHLTCVGHTADEIGSILDDLWKAGIRNVLALRGDPPAGQTQFVKTEGGFAYADELVRYVKRPARLLRRRGRLPRRPPAVPEQDARPGAPEAQGGQRRGASSSRSCSSTTPTSTASATPPGRWGSRVPIVAGIMPILNVDQIKRFISMCGAKIPHPLLLQLEAVESDPEAVHAAGVDYATEQCQDLLSQRRRGDPLLHAQPQQGDGADLQAPGRAARGVTRALREEVIHRRGANPGRPGHFSDPEPGRVTTRADRPPILPREAPRPILRKRKRRCTNARETAGRSGAEKAARRFSRLTAGRDSVLNMHPFGRQPGRIPEIGATNEPGAATGAATGATDGGPTGPRDREAADECSGVRNERGDGGSRPASPNGGARKPDYSPQPDPVRRPGGHAAVHVRRRHRVLLPQDRRRPRSTSCATPATTSMWQTDLQARPRAGPALPPLRPADLQDLARAATNTTGRSSTRSCTRCAGWASCRSSTCCTSACPTGWATSRTPTGPTTSPSTPTASPSATRGCGTTRR